MANVFDFISANYAQWLYGLATVSVVFLIVSILFIPYLVARIPADYFLASDKSESIKSRSWHSLIWLFLRNIFGAFLILAGIIMLALPGQGILTILAGLFVMNFPGKYKLERYIVSKPAVLNSLNWIRRRQKISEIRIN